MIPPTQPDRHSDVGAYALGVLDAADAERFERHLVGCDRCAAELEELMGLTPVLAEFKESAPTPDTLTAVPGPGSSADCSTRSPSPAAAGPAAGCSWSPRPSC
ncbi:zf-HC2 domain-containing protein [Streptomyces endophytica]|uniref:anti-sigma factor family protein n=1 Tax=Streptomyces endophytica TaxID=2991496 RepID=UPI00311B0E96